MIFALILLQSALPSASIETETTRTERREFHWEWSSESETETDTRSEIERANEESAGPTNGWVEVSPGVYEFRAPEPVADDKDDWGLSGYYASQGGCTAQQRAERERLAAALGRTETGCERRTFDPAAEDNPDLEGESAEAENTDSPRWDGRVQLAPGDPEG